jgi:hypothetical protein
VAFFSVLYCAVSLLPFGWRMSFHDFYVQRFAAFFSEVEGNLNIAAALKNKTVNLFKGCNEMFTSHKVPLFSETAY